MNKKLLFAIVFALAITTSSCLSLNRKKKAAMTAQVETRDADNYSLEELLDFPIQEQISCSDSAHYQEVRNRMNRFISFFNDNPVDDLQAAIKSLSQASLLLKRARSGFEKLKSLEEDSQALSQTLIQIKDKKDSVVQHLSDIDDIVNPAIFNELQNSIDTEGLASYDQAIEKLDHAIDLISQLKSQYLDLIDEQDTFVSYSEYLQEKVSKIDNVVQNCQA